MDNIQYNTPQDKLLVMLLERIGHLEDEVKKHNIHMERILSATTSRWFGINISGKYIKDTMNHENVEQHLEPLKKIINSCFPETKVYVKLYSNNDAAHLIIETKETWLLQSIEYQLHRNIRPIVNVNCWNMYHKGVPNNYKLIV